MIHENARHPDSAYGSRTKKATAPSTRSRPTFPAHRPSKKLVLKATAVHPLGYPTVEAVVAMGKETRGGEAAAPRSRIQMYP